MLLTLFVGSAVRIARWRDAVWVHAAWVGLAPVIAEFPLRNGAVCAVAHLVPHGSASTPGDPVTNGRVVVAGAPRDNSPFVEIVRGEVRVTLPPATPAPIYLADLPEGRVLADDLRLFARLMPVELDPRGVYALFQFGAVPPPFTLLAGITRLPPGRECRIPVPPAPVVNRLAFHASPPRAAADAPDPGRLVAEALDTLLADVPRGSVLCFSGGVDSSLLAARLVHLGRRDVQLVNYRFGPDDPESAHAQHMAAALGLDLHVVPHDPARVGDMIDRIGADYTRVFGDVSVVPTNLLLRAALPLAADSRTMIEGTGADGAFGLGAAYAAWRQVYRIPRTVRRGVAAMFRALGLWRGRSRAERVTRFVRRSTELPLELAVVAQNSLAHIAYAAPAERRAAVRRALQQLVEPLADGDPASRVSLLDVMLVCAGRMASKSFDPLRQAGVRPVYPFLHPAVLEIAAAIPWSEKCPGGEEKGLLKRLLAAHVPPELVYRPKRGFTPSSRALFASAPLQQYLNDSVLSPANPLLAYCRPDRVRDLVRRARREPVSIGASDFLWALTFASRWLEQLPREARCG